jgi:hypothetical protein
LGVYGHATDKVVIFVRFSGIVTNILKLIPIAHTIFLLYAHFNSIPALYQTPSTDTYIHELNSALITKDIHFSLLLSRSYSLDLNNKH